MIDYNLIDIYWLNIIIDLQQNSKIIKITVYCNYLYTVIFYKNIDIKYTIAKKGWKIEHKYSISNKV